MPNLNIQSESGVRRSDGTIRKHIVLTGILQGIGCRPTVYRLATKLDLGGWVINTTSGVIIEVEGSLDRCERFTRELPEAIPFPGRIDSLSEEEISPLGESDFRIDASLEGKRSVTPIPPDVAVCDECVEELLDPKNPRYLYPFTTCTLCGPRFTVVRSFPYDRERTSMADFTMCPRCREEYETPHDRRFHSQTNSCPQCGPKLELTDAKGTPIDGNPLLQATAMFASGKILAVKGIGGFHLACDARNRGAVALLRERKGRAEKPFAVMMPNLEIVRRYCLVNAVEERILASPIAPIVLLDASGEKLADNVAPMMGTLGVMLPYSPVHHLFFKHPEVPQAERLTALVMTSGNRSEEPIARDNEEALQRLGDLVDAFLFHDREIVLRADDSIFRVMLGLPTVFRRSRGLVPGGFKVESTDIGSHEDRLCGGAEQSDPVVLGTGGDLKNSLAVIKGDQLVPGPHVGDLASPVAQEYFKLSADLLTAYLEADPTIVAVDPHPQYFSTGLGRDMTARVEEVFHHHAHAVSLLFQHHRTEATLFAVFDGTGYGTDGTIWGGEFLLADREQFSRLGHLGLFPLPGGEAAIREPVRILAALLGQSQGRLDEFISLMGEHGEKAPFWLEMVKKGLNSPLTSSAGRLFDAVAAAVGFTRPVTFEGQAAMWLENIADKAESGTYKVRFSQGSPLVADVADLTRDLARDILSGTRKDIVAARFHNTMAALIVEVATRMSARTGGSVVGLTGGCFQNRFLTERAAALLREGGFHVLLHETIPPNDGGIALGQVVAARARYARRQTARVD